MKKNKRKKSKGFTLIELLLSMALLSVLLVVMTDILVSVMDVKTASEAVSAVDEDAKFIMARLSYDINRADAISSPSGLGNTSENLQLTIGGSNLSYSLDGSDLQLTDGSGTNNLNSSETTISDVSFQKIGNSGGKETIKINMTVTSVAERIGKGKEAKIISGTIGRR
jgi:prepilin-type N-terminal cleavage/methylation domain-containing protein